MIERSLPDELFLKGPRASSTPIPDSTSNVSKKDNIAPMLTKLALLTKTRSETSHQAVERFFLHNDSKTVCSELPVFLEPHETDLKQLPSPLTGHIDLIQTRFNRLYIMDYITRTCSK